MYVKHRISIKNSHTIAEVISRPQENNRVKNDFFSLMENSKNLTLNETRTNLEKDTFSITILLMWKYQN